MIRGSSEIGVRERDATVRPIAQHVARGRAPVGAEEETWLRIHVGVSPAIEDDPGDVATWIEASRGEHVAELLTKRALVARERCA